MKHTHTTYSMYKYSPKQRHWWNQRCDNSTYALWHWSFSSWHIHSSINTTLINSNTFSNHNLPFQTSFNPIFIHQKHTHTTPQSQFSFIPMAKTSTSIIRRSIFSFLQNYQHFTSTPALLLLPFAASTLLAPPLVSSSYLLPLVRNRLSSLFLAAGIPPSSPLLNFINLKLSQTLLTFLFITPFSYSSLLLAKAAVIETLHHNNTQSQLHFIKLFNPLLITQLCNSLLILAANSTFFFFIAIIFNCFDILGLSSPSSVFLLSAIGFILYSIILANAFIVCNLALISSAIENRGGFVAILKACALIQGRTATALSLALPINFTMASIEALFHYRVIGAYDRDSGVNYSAIVLEGMLIAYLYAMILILDTVVGSFFWRSCNRGDWIDQDQGFSHMIEIQVREDEFYAKSKAWILFFMVLIKWDSWILQDFQTGEICRNVDVMKWKGVFEIKNQDFQKILIFDWLSSFFAA